MIKLQEPYALPPKISVKSKLWMMRNPYSALPIALSIVGMISANRGWLYRFNNIGVILYISLIFLIALSIFAPEDEMMITILSLSLKNYFFNKKKDYQYRPENEVFEPDWKIKTIRKEEK